MEVGFRRISTGQVAAVKIGWSWPCFFFGTLFGIPFFWRGMYREGFMMIGYLVVCLLLPDRITETLGAAMGFAASFVLGKNGNKLAGKHYLRSGWEFADPDSAEAEMARGEWGVA